MEYYPMCPMGPVSGIPTLLGVCPALTRGRVLELEIRIVSFPRGEKGTRTVLLVGSLGTGLASCLGHCVCGEGQVPQPKQEKRVSATINGYLT